MTIREGTVMNGSSSLFCQIPSIVNRSRFGTLTAEHQSDRGGKGAGSSSRFAAMLSRQSAQAKTFREIEGEPLPMSMGRTGHRPTGSNLPIDPVLSYPLPSTSPRRMAPIRSANSSTLRMFPVIVARSAAVFAIIDCRKRIFSPSASASPVSQ